MAASQLTFENSKKSQKFIHFTDNMVEEVAVGAEHLS